MLLDVGIQERIKERLDAMQMSANEPLTLLADIARGDIGEFMSITKDGERFSLSLEGNTKLLHKIRQKTTYISSNKGDDREIDELHIELYDAQAALDKILRVHGRYKNEIKLDELPILVFGAKPDDESSGNEH